MKKYVKLSVDVTAYYSGATYEEEVFLPLDVWEEIKEGFDRNLYIHGLDGKHSELKCTIEVDEDVSQKYLESYVHSIGDGEDLFYHIYEFLDEEKYDNRYLMNIQDEVHSYQKSIVVTYKIHKDDREALDKFVEGLKTNGINE